MEVFLVLVLYAKASVIAQRSISGSAQEICPTVDTFGNGLLGIENMKGTENHALSIHTMFSASFASSCHTNTCPIAVELPKTAGATVISIPILRAYPGLILPRRYLGYPLQSTPFGYVFTGRSISELRNC